MSWKSKTRLRDVPEVRCRWSTEVIWAFLRACDARSDGAIVCRSKSPTNGMFARDASAGSFCIRPPGATRTSLVTFLGKSAVYEVAMAPPYHRRMLGGRKGQRCVPWRTQEV